MIRRSLGVYALLLRQTTSTTIATSTASAAVLTIAGGWQACRRCAVGVWCCAFVDRSVVGFGSRTCLLLLRCPLHTLNAAE
uniref:Putative secreted protein n=1 Tax=Anopheles darlingi TaxID=43151 RepID=A0A2M4D0W2_ANODA